MGQRDTRILSPTPESLALAAERLREGDLVAMPTETVYGLAGDALNPDAVLAIFATKERPHFDPLIVHVPPAPTARSADGTSPALGMLVDLGLLDPRELSPGRARTAALLISKFWPGPLTLVLPKASKVPDLVTSGLPSVAIRMPAHPVAQELLRESGRPLAAPSANRFGRISPTTAHAVEAELGGRIGWILDGGPCKVGIESTVVRIEEDGTAILLRPGGAPVEEIEAALSEIACKLLRPSSGGTGSQNGSQTETEAQSAPQLSPGRLLSHYAPEKKLRLAPAPFAMLTDAELAALAPAENKLGILLFAPPSPALAERLNETFGGNAGMPLLKLLSKNADSAEAARNLFSALRELDASDATALIAEPAPESDGLCHAINDRLRRAAH